jgi:site-specific DNA recombinase
MKNQSEFSKTELKFPVLERAVLYARVSGDDRKKEGRNLAGQLEMGRKYATENNYTVVVELAEDDKGASGAEIDLPKLNKVREMARTGQFDVLVVREIDRLSRNLAKQLIVEQELEGYGVRIEYVLGEYADNPEGALQKHIKGAIAEYEREKIKERMSRGKRNKAKSGKVIRSSKSPYGYKFSGDTLSVCESEARIVKQIFVWCLEGLGTLAISNELNKLHVPTPKGGNQWRSSTVGIILKNRTYTGTWEFGKKKRVRNYKITWLNHPQDYRIAVDVPVIIDEAIFEAARAQLKRKLKYTPGNTKYHYLMTKRIRCQCGAAVSAYTTTDQRKKKYAYYSCYARKRPKLYGHTCNLPTFKKDEVDELVWAKLEDYVHNPDKLVKGMQQYQQEMDQVSRPLTERLTTIDGLLEDYHKEFDETAAALKIVKGKKSKALFAKDLDRIEQAIAGLQAEQAKVLDKLQRQSVTDQHIDTVFQFAVEMVEDWDRISKDPESRREFIQLIDAQLTLMVVDGKRKGLLEAKLSAKMTIWFDDEEQLCIPNNNN